MTEDAMKTVGCGIFLDWRWRCAIQYRYRIESADTPEEYYAGPGEKTLLSDKVLVKIVFPYLKQCLHPESGAAMPENHAIAMTLALKAAEEKAFAVCPVSQNLEAGILSGRPLGDLLPNPEEWTTLAQILYEQLFFDVRHCLDDAAALCRVLFRDREQVYSHGTRDLLSKVIAYELGFDEYCLWNKDTPSGKAKLAQAATKDVLRYLDGLDLLGVNDPDGMGKAFTRLFAVLPDITVQANCAPGAKRHYHKYTPGEMTAISAMIPVSASSAE